MRAAAAAVNSEPGRKLTSHVSAQGLAVLHALASAKPHYHPDSGNALSAGELAVVELVKIVARRGTSRGVTKASLSRTLRRLWRAGLVELMSGWGWSRTMTQAHHAECKHRAARDADPVAAYEEYKAIVTSYDMPDAHGSAEAYMAAMRVADRRLPDVRVTRVQITKAGRARLTRSCTPELTAREAGQRRWRT